MKNLLQTGLSCAFAIALMACNPARQQEAENKVDSLQRELEQELDTAGEKLDSLGDSLKDAADNLLNEAGKTLEKAGEKLKEEGENTSGN